MPIQLKNHKLSPKYRTLSSKHPNINTQATPVAFGEWGAGGGGGGGGGGGRGPANAGRGGDYDITDSDSDAIDSSDLFARGHVQVSLAAV